MEIRPILSALMRNKTGPILVAIQVALSLAILANALHIVNVRQATAARPSGIADEQSVFYMQVQDLAQAGFEDEVATRERELAALRAVPGVVAAAQVNQVPMTHSGSNSGWSVDRKQSQITTLAAMYFTPGALLKTWGLKLVEGRDFTPDEYADIDTRTSDEFPKLAIITSKMAEKMSPGQSAVGKTIYVGLGEDARPIRVVGVVERLQTPFAQVSDDVEYSAIMPVRLASGSNFGTYAVRAEPGQIERVMRDAEEAVRKSSPVPKVIEKTSMTDERKDCYRSDNAMAWMLITVSSLLLLITASGIVGMASLWVTQRRKQIGVRRALGARRVDILRYFITENFLITSTGVFSGVLLAIGLNQLLVSKLEMARLPLGYLGFGAGLFWLLGVFAVYGPAWRAASISPAMATRTA
ncbi:ABC transporter permease [Massilia horti]|uniref:FtsX-like permease family protein n=1 Tax=Massilia horti TaxID=2562153 RepID=A0A4Y9T7J7_9BURK|nr:FtsX-like permease family protein [Massilia horti]TFW35229.1 FtsX-like permease family protein [Massilia horti]